VFACIKKVLFQLGLNDKNRKVNIRGTCEMATESKYYFITTNYSAHNLSQVVKWNEDYYVEVKEDVDFIQSVGLTINKFSDSKNDKPKNSKYEKVKPILKEVFLDHYRLAIRLINKQLNIDGEFYLLKNSKDWIQVQSYTNAKRNVSIDFRDAIDSLWFRVCSTPSMKSRPTSRKHGTSIAREQFDIFLRLALKFLYDSDSYRILLDSFISNFYSLAEEGEDIENLMFNTDQSLKDIMKQLELRKRNLEKRLIEVDTDNDSERIKFRGEINGIDYSINTIKKYQ